MYYHEASNQYIRPDSSGFTIDGNQYPAGWLNVTTAEDRLALGLEEVITVGERGDDRFFFVSETLDKAVRTIVNTPKPIEMLQQYEKSILDEKLIKLRSVREDILNRLAGIAFTAQITDNTEIVDAYVAARQSLLDITNDLPESLEDAIQLITVRYVTLVQTALSTAPSLEAAFNTIDL